MSGGTEFLKDSLGVLKSNCLTEVEVNLTRWEAPPGSNRTAPPTYITQTLCPENCSGHGLCVQGNIVTLIVQLL